MCIPFDHVILLQSIYPKEAIEIHINIMHKNNEYSFIYNSEKIERTKCTQ